MRVIAGVQKGRRLQQPTGSQVRPTSERVREALFSILANRLPGATFLDLYAGTGAMGIEALSRGARQVIFVEPHPSSIRTIRENLSRCEFSREGLIVPTSATGFLRQDADSEGAPPFDIIFADPPYHTGDLSELLDLLGHHGRVSDHTLLVLEHFSKTSVPQKAGRLMLSRHRRYGDTTLSFFEIPKGKEAV